MSNTLRQIMSNTGHFFIEPFLHAFSLVDIDKEINEYLFILNRLFQFKPNNLFVLIHRYSTLLDLLWPIMSNYSF